MRAPTFLRITAGAVLFGVLLCGCHHQPSAVPVLRVGYASHDHHAPLFVAASLAEQHQQAGDLHLEPVRPTSEYRLRRGDEELARVRIDSVTGGRALIQRLAEDQFDLVFGSFPSMVRFIQQGSPIRIVAPVMAGGNGLVVHPSLPVHSWQEFVTYIRQRREPVKIGCKAAGSVQTFLLEEALRSAGLTYSWALDDRTAPVVLIDLHGPANLIPSLEQRLIDAFVVMQPYLAQAEERGVGRTILVFEQLTPTDGEPVPYPCCALASRPAYLSEHRKVVEAMVDLLRQTSHWMREHPDRTARLVARWLDEPVEVERRALETIVFVSDFGPEWTAGANAWVELLVRQEKLPAGLLPRARNGTLWSSFIDPVGMAPPTPEEP